MSDHLLLVDATAYAHRAFWSSVPSYREDGFPTWAILGFMSMLWRTLGAAESDKPRYGVAVFDATGPTFRHKLYPPYKAHRIREGRVLELTPQLPMMREAARTLGFTAMEHSGFEADDVVATIARKAVQNGIRVSIVSSDKDFLQCVKDGQIEVVDPLSRSRKLEADVIKKFGVLPKLVADVQALAGDAADGYPGVKGIGLGAAAGLVRRFGSLKGVMDAVAGGREHFPAQQRVELKRALKDLPMFKKLAVLRQDVPLKFDWEDLVMQPVLKAHIVEILKALEASGKVEALFALDPKLARPAERVADPLEWYREEMAASGQKIPDEPQAGYYQRRLVRQGPFVPARIWREPELDANTGEPTGADLILCEVDGRRRDPLAEWARLATQPITVDEYRFLVKNAEWARTHAPHDPAANPRRAIDLNQLPPPVFSKRKVRK